MSEAVHPLARLVGAILIAVGGLIAVLSGGCTLAVFGFSLFDAVRSGQGGEGLSISLMALLFGAPVFAIGAGMFFLGRGLFRGRKARPSNISTRPD